MMIRYLLFFSLLLFATNAIVGAEVQAPVIRAGITATETESTQAKDLLSQGWIYQMPSPKSAQAAWGNSDGRTTWWVGFWSNKKLMESSTNIPSKGMDGIYHGDGKGAATWRRGGSPAPPSRIEWLCSLSGGIIPR